RAAPGCVLPTATTWWRCGPETTSSLPPTAGIASSGRTPRGRRSGSRSTTTDRRRAMAARGADRSRGAELRVAAGAGRRPHVHALALTPPSVPQPAPQAIHRVRHPRQPPPRPKSQEATEGPRQGPADRHPGRPRSVPLDRVGHEPLQHVHGPPGDGHVAGCSIGGVVERGGTGFRERRAIGAVGALDDRRWKRAEEIPEQRVVERGAHTALPEVQEATARP